jgi:hypothetical protein
MAGHCLGCARAALGMVSAGLGLSIFCAAHGQVIEGLAVGMGWSLHGLCLFSAGLFMGRPANDLLRAWAALGLKWVRHGMACAAPGNGWAGIG